MSKILFGVIAALILSVTALSYRLDSVQEDNETLATNNNTLEQAVTDSQASYDVLVATQAFEQSLQADRTQEREQQIYALSRKAEQLATIPDDDCLDRRMPDAVLRMLDGEGGTRNEDEAPDPAGVPP